MKSNPMLRARKGSYLFNSEVDLHYYTEFPDGRISYVSKIETTLIDPNDGTAPNAQPITLDMTAAQALMDDLFALGIRPTEGSGSAGAFAAQGRHLEDMRKLVFKEKE